MSEWKKEIKNPTLADCPKRLGMKHVPVGNKCGYCHRPISELKQEARRG